MTQTTTFMARHCYRRVSVPATDVRSDRRHADSPGDDWYVGALRILLVVNSFASSVTARNTVVIQRRSGRDHDVELVETNRRGHATRFAHDAARRGVDVVVGFGGDGTLNEVANGIAGTDTALGALPGGSTNVFARTIGLPNDPVAAADLLADGIDAGNIRPIGLGPVNGRYFCFHIGVGFDAAVVAAVERRASLKRWLGHPLFITAALTHVAPRLRPHAARTSGSIDRRTASIDDGYFTIVLNTNPYTYLGNRPLDLSPAATLRPRARGDHVPVAAGDARSCSARSPARCAAAACSRLGDARRADRPRPRSSIEHEHAVPVPGRRRLPRRGRPPRVPPRPRRRPPRLPVHAV